MEPETIVTTNHEEIRNWIEAHNGLPAIRDKRENKRGIIEIDFTAEKDIHTYEIISWEEFFDTFDSLNMEFHYDPNEKEISESKQYSYSFVTRRPGGLLSGDIDNELEMPEDDIPIENVVPSAPPPSMPDGTRIQII